MRSSSRPVEAVTLDAFGTLIELADPVPALQAALADRDVIRGRDEVARAFRAEASFYVPRSLEGRDEPTLATLRRRCAAVFLEEVGAELDPEEFATALVGALAYRPIDGVPEALERLGASGLALACVANWDYTLPEHLATAGLLDRASLDPQIVYASPDRAGHRGRQLDDEIVSHQLSAIGCTVGSPCTSPTLPSAGRRRLAYARFR